VEASKLAGGGAPTLGEPLAIELVNTRYAIRGRDREGLQTPENLGAWLRDLRPRLNVLLTDADLLAVSERDVTAAITLRAAIRELASAVCSMRDFSTRFVETLNEFASGAPSWSELRTTPTPRAERCSRAPAVTVALAVIAEDAILILGGPARAELKRCSGPGCVLFFLRSAVRREYCSAGCGNRARAARHYAKAHARS